MSRSLLKISCSLVFGFIAVSSAFAGGPLVVGGPNFGTDGQPFTWDPAKMPIQYTVDPGPMASTSSGTVVIDNKTGLQRVQNMFAVWQAVPTATVSFSNAGTLLSAGSYVAGTDLTTATQYNDVVGSCQKNAQNPIIFDADSKLMQALGLPPEVIGFTSGCALDPVAGHLTGALIVMNGIFQDKVDARSSNPPNFELTANEFDEAITHEIGHFLGLDHSQINLDLFTKAISTGSGSCDVDELAGIPLMFPVEFCQARKDAGLPLLSSDDVSWISTLYPNPATYPAGYGTISGRIFFSDGVTQAQGVNVIARTLDDPGTTQDESRRVAVSAISGYLFTGNPGQSITQDMSDPAEHNAGGDTNGSRNPQFIGYYQIAVPPGTYTIEVESIYTAFNSDSGIGPLNPPVPLPGGIPKFWQEKSSAFDLPFQRDKIQVNPGENVPNLDIILNGTQPRFDGFEDSGSLWNALPGVDGNDVEVSA
jgi:hypothetical protein